MKPVARFIISVIVVLFVLFSFNIKSKGDVYPHPAEMSQFCKDPVGLAIDGEISEATYMLVKLYLSCVESHTTTLIALNSKGGSVTESLKIARLMRKLALERNVSFTTLVRPGAFCASACAIIFAGGPDKMSFGKIGLHRPYFTEFKGSELERSMSTLRNRLDQFITDFGISQKFLDYMIITPPDDIKIFHGEEIFELVPREDPVVEARSIERQAKRYGITPKEYRRRDARVDAKCGTYTLSMTDSEAQYQWYCRRATLWGISIENYIKHLEDVEACRADYGPFTNARTSCIQKVLGLRQ